jgi:hypothetical protein
MRAGSREVKRHKCRAPRLSARTANPGLMDLHPAGIRGRSATFRSLQRANGRRRWKVFARAGLSELKRRERRAPDAEFGERFPRVGAGGPSGTDRLSGADRQPGADGFESRWDERMERLLLCAVFRQ